MLRAMLRRLLAAARARVPPSLEQVLALLEEGRLKEAESVAREACIARPDDAQPRQLLGHVLSQRGEFSSAIVALEQAREIDPDNAEVHYALGRAHFGRYAFVASIAAFRSSLDVAPKWPPPWVSLADALAAIDSVDAAEDAYRRALELSPDLAVAHYNYGNLLLRLGRADEAVSAYKRALELKPGFKGAHTNLVYALNFLNSCTPEQVFEAHVAWAREHAEPLTAKAEPHARPRRSRQPLRVGYVSPNFRAHAVTYFFEPVLRHHDSHAFRVYCYADVKLPDATTARLRGYGAIWTDVAGRSDEDVAARIRRDGIDILVDLTGLTENDRLLLFARKPAPIQITWNGYANTTGMTAIDYRITDAYADPPGPSDALHVERLLRLPEIYMPFEAPREDVAPAGPPSLERGFCTFGSFNAISKLNDRTIRLWSRILAALPSARLMMLTVPQGRTRERIVAAFASQGVTADRLDLRPRLDHAAFLAAHNDADIALDAFPFHGTTTTAHTLWMGVPLITLSGRVHAGRVGVSMLSNAGLSDLVARSEDDYVALAVELARDGARLQDLRRTLRARMCASPNMDGARFTRHLEDAYRKVWAAYCETFA